MVKKTVLRGEFWTEKSGSLIAWAISETDGALVHILMLNENQVGQKCGCLCPGCCGKLESVNAALEARDPGKSPIVRPHFRHEAGQQKRSCLLAAARFAALHLLLQQDAVELPAPQSARKIQGASGKLYSGTYSGTSLLCRLKSTHWVDRQTAQITLPDGKVVQIQLAGHTHIDEKVDGVIVIQVNDPEVATWPPDKILSLARLNSQWFCWERHWEQNELDARAQAAAVSAATDACDYVAPDLTLPTGQSPLQRSESVLHWVLKEILAETLHLPVGRLAERVLVEHFDDRRATTVVMNALTLKLSNVRLEQRLDGLVPDVFCHAEDLSGQLGDFELLIEVAVTHRVSAPKLQLIRKHGLACIELDASRIAAQGRVTRQELRQLLLHGSAAQWLHAPSFDLKVQQARSTLEEQMRRSREAQVAWERVVDSFARLEKPEAVTAYLKEVTNEWRSAVKSDVQDPYSDTDNDRLDLAANALSRHGMPHCKDVGLWGDGRLLWQIMSIRSGSKRNRQGPRRLIEKAYNGEPQQKQIVTLLLTALKVYAPPMNATDYSQLHLIRDEVLRSLRNGELTYARHTKHDALLSLAFPEMAKELSKPLGTVAEAHQVTQKRQAEETERRRLALEREADETRKREEKQSYEKASAHAYTQKWAKQNEIPLNLAYCLREVPNFPLDTQSTHAFLKAAWEARERGVSISDFLKELNPTSGEAILRMIKVLEKAWLTA